MGRRAFRVVFGRLQHRWTCKAEEGGTPKRKCGGTGLELKFWASVYLSPSGVCPSGSKLPAKASFRTSMHQ